MPEEWVAPSPGGQAPVFDDRSFAYHQVLCEDLEARSSIVAARFLARDALNQALMTMGLALADSPPMAIDAALANAITTQKQARYVGRF